MKDKKKLMYDCEECIHYAQKVIDEINKVKREHKEKRIEKILNKAAYRAECVTHVAYSDHTIRGDMRNRSHTTEKDKLFYASAAIMDYFISLNEGKPDDEVIKSTEVSLRDVQVAIDERLYREQNLHKYKD